MAGEIILVDRDDIIYPVKLIVNSEIKTKFSGRVVSEMLKKFGFQETRNDLRATLSFSRGLASRWTLYRDHIVCEVGSFELAFSQDLANDEIERIKSELHGLLVTRVQILTNAAEQNISSGLINLFQNQKRASVSDTYYALHNALAAIQEYYLLQGKLDATKIPSELSRESADEESRLGHCSPAVAQPVIDGTNLMLLWNSTVEDILSSDQLRASSKARDRESHRNPFVWLAIILREILNLATQTESTKIQQSHQQHLIELSEQVRGFLSNAEFEALGIGGKNEAIETHYKHLHKQIHQIINQTNGNEPESIFVRSLLSLTDFLMFTQLLRLSGDYDSSFEIKHRLQDVVYCVLSAARFVELERCFVEKVQLKTESSIQNLATRFNKSLLGLPDSAKTPNEVLYFGGAIHVRDFDLIETVRKLYQSKGYSLAQLDGRTQKVRSESEAVTLSKPIPGFDRLICFLTLHRSGLYWLEMADDPFESFGHRFKQLAINTHYLDVLIDSHFIQDDILGVFSKGATIYRAMSESLKVREHSYAFVLDNLIDGPYLTRSLSQMLEKAFSLKGFDLDKYDIMFHWIRSHAALHQRERAIWDSPSRRYELSQSNKSVVFVVVPFIHLSNDDREQIRELILQRMRRFSESNATKHFYVDFFTHQAIDDALLGDTTLLEASITAMFNRLDLDNQTEALTVNTNETEDGAEQIDENGDE